jgi:DcuC family C4-dicarboxylate transporter
MPPVAGGVIILAGIAGVNPFEAAKRTALLALIALIATTVAMYTLN